jgi:hypothetical protein
MSAKVDSVCTSKMRPEIAEKLGTTDLGRCLIAMCQHDDETDSAIEAAYQAAYQEGMMQERERQLAIDRVGGEESLETAEFLASAMAKARNR